MLSNDQIEFAAIENEIRIGVQTLLKCKYVMFTEAIEQIKSDCENKEILVPLKGSVYVLDVMKNVDNFVIDVGTGYYVEKNLDDTKAYFKRKVDYVQEQIEKTYMLQMKKSRFLYAVHEVIEMKVIAQQSKQQLAA